MATLDSSITETWADIKTSLSLTEGKTYVVDLVTGNTVYLRESPTAPTSTIGHPIDTGESRRVTITSEKLWARSDGQKSKIVLTPEA